jgi:hypothetical protein
MRQCRIWTREEMKTLIVMHKEGYSNSEIGNAINRTECAIYTQVVMMRLGKLDHFTGRPISDAYYRYDITPPEPSEQWKIWNLINVIQYKCRTIRSKT